MIEKYKTLLTDAMNLVEKTDQDEYFRLIEIMKQIKNGVYVAEVDRLGELTDLLLSNPTLCKVLVVIAVNSSQPAGTK